MKSTIVNGELVVTAQTQAEAITLMKCLGLKTGKGEQVEKSEEQKTPRKRRMKKECPQCGRMFKAGGLQLHIYKAHKTKSGYIPVQDLTHVQGLTHA